MLSNMISVIQETLLFGNPRTILQLLFYLSIKLISKQQKYLFNKRFSTNLL